MSSSYLKLFIHEREYELELPSFWTFFPYSNKYICLSNTLHYVSNQQYQKGFNNEEMSSLMPILQGIDKTVSKQNVTTEVLGGLLTFLRIILVSIVVYLCYTRGISSLSPDNEQIQCKGPGVLWRPSAYWNLQFASPHTRPRASSVCCFPPSVSQKSSSFAGNSTGKKDMRMSEKY